MCLHCAGFVKLWDLRNIRHSTPILSINTAAIALAQQQHQQAAGLTPRHRHPHAYILACWLVLAFVPSRSLLALPIAVVDLSSLCPVTGALGLGALTPRDGGRGRLGAGAGGKVGVTQLQQIAWCPTRPGLLVRALFLLPCLGFRVCWCRGPWLCSVLLLCVLFDCRAPSTRTTTACASGTSGAAPPPPSPSPLLLPLPLPCLGLALSSVFNLMCIMLLHI